MFIRHFMNRESAKDRPVGGFTVIGEVRANVVVNEDLTVDPDKIEKVVCICVSRCSHKDDFSKKEGVKRALDGLFRSLSLEFYNMNGCKTKREVEKKAVYEYIINNWEELVSHLKRKKVHVPYFVTKVRG